MKIDESKSSILALLNADMTREEAQKLGEEVLSVFDEADKNSDKKLSLEELNIYNSSLFSVPDNKESQAEQKKQVKEPADSKIQNKKSKKSEKLTFGDWAKSFGKSGWKIIKGLGCNKDGKFSIGKTLKTIGIAAGCAFLATSTAPIAAAITAGLGVIAVIGGAITAINGVKKIAEGHNARKEATTREEKIQAIESTTDGITDVAVGGLLTYFGVKGTIKGCKNFDKSRAMESFSNIKNFFTKLKSGKVKVTTGSSSGKTAAAAKTITKKGAGIKNFAKKHNNSLTKGTVQSKQAMLVSDANEITTFKSLSSAQSLKASLPAQSRIALKTSISNTAKSAAKRAVSREVLKETIKKTAKKTIPGDGTSTYIDNTQKAKAA